jgi:hypothetical protein
MTAPSAPLPGELTSKPYWLIEYREGSKTVGYLMDMRRGDGAFDVFMTRDSAKALRFESEHYPKSLIDDEAFQRTVRNADQFFVEQHMDIVATETEADHDVAVTEAMHALGAHEGEHLVALAFRKADEIDALNARLQETDANWKAAEANVSTYMEANLHLENKLRESESRLQDEIAKRGEVVAVPRKIDQTVIGVNGNCQSACLAMLLGLPLSAVPNFLELPGAMDDDAISYQAQQDWLNARGWGLVTIQARGPFFKRHFSKGYVLVGGKSSRGLPHAVVYKDGELWHDPHPERGGLVEIGEVDVLFPLAPFAAESRAAALQKRWAYLMRKVSFYGMGGEFLIRLDAATDPVSPSAAAELTEKVDAALSKESPDE